MKRKRIGVRTPNSQTTGDASVNNMLYPIEEDIYVKGKKMDDINPEDITTLKVPNEIETLPNEKTFEGDLSGNDLDIPGSELDDEDESVGSEDEENNHYSLGGDNHNNLEEDDFRE